MSAAGKWNVTLNTPMGAQIVTLTLEAEGATLSGSIEGPQGSQSFEGGKIEGNGLSWVVKMTQPMEMTLAFSAEVDADKISGNVDLGSFGSASFEGTRA